LRVFGVAGRLIGGVGAGGVEFDALLSFLHVHVVRVTAELRIGKGDLVAVGVRRGGVRPFLLSLVVRRGHEILLAFAKGGDGRGCKGCATGLP
jgi:hypothetical protein